ncbi:uncharacterized protein [Centruroides vittatus]|uniref:uncharacterized protein n=1 Tax=Centruroides vittatus TaxID=120091 RepID=UPI00350EB618
MYEVRLRQYFSWYTLPHYPIPTCSCGFELGIKYFTRINKLIYTSKYHMEEKKKEIEQLRQELSEAQNQILVLKEKEKTMRNRLAEQAQRMLERGTIFENMNLGEKRATSFIRRYGELYSQSRIDTLDSLECLTEFQEAEELKSKLMFSIIVLAFHSVQNKLGEIFIRLREIFQIDDSTSVYVKDLENSVHSYLRSRIDKFDLTDCIQEVSNQIWTTLYDFPCLKDCDVFLKYVKQCVRLAWGLINQNPSYEIEYEMSEYRKDLHLRFHSSDQQSKKVKYYLWPALLETNGGACVYKGVVVT